MSGIFFYLQILRDITDFFRFTDDFTINDTNFNFPAVYRENRHHSKRSDDHSMKSSEHSKTSSLYENKADDRVSIGNHQESIGKEQRNKGID